MSIVLEGNADSQDCDKDDSNSNKADSGQEFTLVERSIGQIELEQTNSRPSSPATSTSQSSASQQLQKSQIEHKSNSKRGDRHEKEEEERSIQEIHRETPSTSSQPQQQQQQQQQQQPHQSLLVHPPQSNGYYDAEKCRAHIADQIRVSKIDRFAAQVNKAVEIETSLYSRLSGVFNMFMNSSAQVTYEFTMRCKMSLDRHRQARMLARSGNWKKSSAGNSNSKVKLKLKKFLEQQQQLEQQGRSESGSNKRPTRILSDKCSTISNDLLYGQGVQLLQTLFAKNEKNDKVLSQQLPCASSNIIDYKRPTGESGLGLIDSSLVNSFEPSDYVSKLEEYIRKNMRKSRLINSRLGTLRQMFERLAAEHRNKVDLVYSAEEERQSTTVVRRSAYNLSLVAIKATKTPIHVNLNPSDAIQ